MSQVFYKIISLTMYNKNSYLTKKYWTDDYREYMADLKRRLIELIYSRFTITKKECENIVTLLMWFYHNVSLKWNDEWILFPQFRAEKWVNCIYLFRFVENSWITFEFKYKINSDWSILPLWKVNIRNIEKNKVKEDWKFDELISTIWFIN